MFGSVNRNRRKWRPSSAWIGLLLMAVSFVWLQLSNRATRPQPDVQTTPPEGPFALVVLDPGHGGKDSGTLIGGMSEKDVTLDVARRTERLLQSQGVNTLLTRTSDTYVSLADRAALANTQRKCVFVSIHFDAAKPTATGVETYYAAHQVSWLPFLQLASLDSLNTESRSLAAMIQEALVAHTRAVNRGTSRQQFFVITNTRHPAVLVEGGFLTNADDMNKLGTDQYREQIATAISDGVARYREGLQQQETPLVTELPGNK